MKRNRSKGHSIQQKKLFDEQLKKDGIDPKDKVFLKNAR